MSAARSVTPLQKFKIENVGQLLLDINIIFPIVTFVSIRELIAPKLLYTLPYDDFGYNLTHTYDKLHTR